jgi:hypothetical protein
VEVEEVVVEEVAAEAEKQESISEINRSSHFSCPIFRVQCMPV